MTNTQKIRTAFVFFSLFLIPQLSWAEFKIVRVEGDVRYKRKELSKGQTLQGAGKLVAKGKESYVDIELEGGHKFRLRDGAMKLKEVSEKKVDIRLKKGKFYSSINNKVKNKPKFVLRTKAATMGVRGTKFMIEETDKTYLCVCEGTVRVTKKGSKKVDVSRGEDLFAHKNKKLEKPREATDMMIKMTVEEFAQMGIKVN